MRRRPARPTGARAAGALAAAALVLGAPAIVAAHGLSPAYQSPLPLAVYLVGAAAAVALSFAFVLVRDLRAAPTEAPRRVAVPRPVQLGLRTVGLLGWGWIVVQSTVGGPSGGAVAGLILWVYGWVGLAVLSALLFPVWEWLDPFATLYDISAWSLRSIGRHGWRTSRLPPAAGVWPATIGFAFFVWLELVAVPGAVTLTFILSTYTMLTLALMAYFGRDPWRAHGEVFSVWFRTLGRLPSTGLAEGPDGGVDPGIVVRRRFASALLDADWSASRIALVALGAGSIIFDGGSQSAAFATVFGSPSMVQQTILLLVFLTLVAGAAMLVARTVSPGAIGAGLLPVAVGYFVAHDLTYLLVDGQRIVAAVSDPLATGADLFGTASWTPSSAWLPAGLVWAVQFAAVVGGHMLGAWSGHVTAQRDIAAAAARAARDKRHRVIHDAPPPRNVRLREIPLAVVMVALTTLTLWTLGQAIVQEPATTGAVPAVTQPG